MGIPRASPPPLAASAPPDGTEDLIRELQPVQLLTGNDILHLPEGARGRSSAPDNARGNLSVHSSSLLGLMVRAA